MRRGQSSRSLHGPVSAERGADFILGELKEDSRMFYSIFLAVWTRVEEPSLENPPEGDVWEVRQV